MSFRDCVISARDQGVLSEDEADDLIGRWQRHWEARRGAGEADPEGGARTAVIAELEEEAARKAQLAALSAAKQEELSAYLSGYRDVKGRPDVFGGIINLFENFGTGAGTSSVAGRAKAITALAHGELADMLSTFRRSRLTGRRFNKPGVDNVVREVLGESSGDEAARGMGEAVARVFEHLRERFNAAGGQIGDLGRYLPQFHEPGALLRAGYERWAEFIRPRLDLDRMRDPLTGGRLSPERLEESLRVAYERITTGGWSDREPTARPFGKGALANQRSEHRFLHFRTADDWLAYNREFGAGDPLKAIFQHINGMARDIAAMEVLGPNPSATVEWLKQVAQSEAAKAIAGKPSLYGTSQAPPLIADKLDYLPWRIQSVWDYVRGRQQVSGRWATGFANARNFLTSAQLGAASVLAAATDPFLDMAARYLSGLPMTKALAGIVEALPGRAGMTREKAVRSGLILDDFLHILGDEARYAGTLGGSEWSRWLADRTVNLSGLEPMTQARRHVFALDFQAAFADHAGQAFDALPAYLRRSMEDYGLDARAWDIMRKIEPDRPEGGAGILRPIDVAKRSRPVAEKYLEMIYGQMERAVPTGTARARSFITGTAPRGSVFGEILESGLQYKSFALSFTTLQFQAIQRELHQGGARGAAYASGVALALTLGGGLAMQLKSIIAGKDTQPMDNPKFWIQALQTGGGFGLMGDFMFSDVNRFGHSLGEQLLGPTVGALSDISKLTVGNIQQAIQGKKTNAGREAVNFVGRYTPVASSLWYTRLGYRRVFLDQLQYLADPEAHKAFRDAQRRTMRETHQGYWWPPGEAAPARAPEVNLTAP